MHTHRHTHTHTYIYIHNIYSHTRHMYLFFLWGYILFKNFYLFLYFWLNIFIEVWLICSVSGVQQNDSVPYIIFSDSFPSFFTAGLVCAEELGFFFLPCSAICGTMWDLSSSSRGWICSPSVESQNLNHWTAREVPVIGYYKILNVVPYAIQ